VRVRPQKIHQTPFSLLDTCVSITFLKREVSTPGRSPISVVEDRLPSLDVVGNLAFFSENSFLSFCPPPLFSFPVYMIISEKLTHSDPSSFGEARVGKVLFALNGPRARLGTSAPVRGKCVASILSPSPAFTFDIRGGSLPFYYLFSIFPHLSYAENPPRW